MTEHEIREEQGKFSSGLHLMKAGLAAVALDFVVVGSVLTGKIPMTGDLLVSLGILNGAIALNALSAPTCLEKFLAVRAVRRYAASEKRCG